MIIIIITSIIIMMTIAMSQGKMILHYGDLIDGNCLVHIINTTKPTEIYNLGAQSHVKVVFNDCQKVYEDNDDAMALMQPKTKTNLNEAQRFDRYSKRFEGNPNQVSFDLAEYTAEVDGVGTLRLLDAIR